MRDAAGVRHAVHAIFALARQALRTPAGQIPAARAQRNPGLRTVRARHLGRRRPRRACPERLTEGRRWARGPGRRIELHLEIEVRAVREGLARSVPRHESARDRRVSRSMKSSRTAGRSSCPLGTGNSESSEIGAGTADAALGAGSSASESAIGRSISSPSGSRPSRPRGAHGSWQVDVRSRGARRGAGHRRRKVSAPRCFDPRCFDPRCFEWRRQVEVGKRIEA